MQKQVYSFLAYLLLLCVTPQRAHANAFEVIRLALFSSMANKSFLLVKEHFALAKVDKVSHTLLLQMKESLPAIELRFEPSIAEDVPFMIVKVKSSNTDLMLDIRRNTLNHLPDHISIKARVDLNSLDFKVTSFDEEELQLFFDALMKGIVHANLQLHRF